MVTTAVDDLQPLLGRIRATFCHHSVSGRNLTYRHNLVRATSSLPLSLPPLSLLSLSLVS